MNYNVNMADFGFQYGVDGWWLNGMTITIRDELLIVHKHDRIRWQISVLFRDIDAILSDVAHLINYEAAMTDTMNTLKAIFPGLARVSYSCTPWPSNEGGTSHKWYIIGLPDSDEKLSIELSWRNDRNCWAVSDRSRVSFSSLDHPIDVIRTWCSINPDHAAKMLFNDGPRQMWRGIFPKPF